MIPQKEKKAVTSRGPSISYISSDPRFISEVMNRRMKRLVPRSYSSRTASPRCLFFSCFSTSTTKSWASSSSRFRSASLVMRKGRASSRSKPINRRAAKWHSTCSRNMKSWREGFSGLSGSRTIRGSTEGTGTMAVFTSISFSSSRVMSRSFRSSSRAMFRLLEARKGKGWEESTAIGVTTGKISLSK